ncbi:DUF1835 domain-containing protein [Paenibacillus sp. MBLB4367]|uniref:DUF1835 domain-containing protein n=1 Tax=Paenibacillus sp. MBLB4367 TaxID=3384767 RepID=UPI0039081C8A
MNRLFEIRKAIDGLSSREAKQLLMLIMLQMDLDEPNDEAKAGLYEKVKELYNELLGLKNRMEDGEPNAAASTVHIVFGDSIAGSLKLAIKQQGCADTNKVICFRDLFSIGPLWRLHEEAGRLERSRWFRDNINDGCEDGDRDRDDEAYYHKISEQFAKIPAEASVVIWSGHNAHEQVGLRYAVYLLRNRRNDIVVFDAAEACQRRFNTVERSIDYLHAGEIHPEKLQAVFGEIQEGGPLAHETRQLLEQEWLSLAEHHEVLRIWTGERIRNVDEHYFDSYLLETVEKLHNDDFIKAARVIGEALGYCEQYIGDSYLEYRLRHLIYSGRLEIKGVPRAMRYYSVRRKFYWKQARTMNYVALGDSITAFRPGVKTYFERLQENGAELGFAEMTNSGVPGWNTANVLADLDSKCLRLNPSVVTIMLGTNDHAIYKGTDAPAVSEESYERNLRQIIDRILSVEGEDGVRPANRAVILMTPPFASTHVNVAGTDVSQSRLLAYCEIVKRLSREKSTGLVDVNTITGEAAGWDDDRYFQTFTDKNDGVHLNSEGQQILAPHVREAIIQALEAIRK